MLVLFCIIGLFTLVLSQQDHPYGITVVNNNFEQVISTNSPISILFYSASCQHSTSYKELFEMAAIKYKEQSLTKTLGMVNCDTDKVSCDKYKVNVLPSVLTFDEHGTFKREYQQAFIAQSGVIFNNQFLAQNISRWLEDQPNYFVAIFEEEGFEAQNKLKAERVLYLQDSQLYKLLLGYTRGRIGCWIFKYSKATSRLQKYICGSGMNPHEISSNLRKFKEGELNEFIFSANANQQQFHNEKQLNHNQLLEFQESDVSPKIILFDSGDCWYCNGVAAALSVSLQRLPQNNLKFHHYLADIHEVPHSKTIMKLPYLQLWINNQITVYEGRFSEKNLREFLLNKIPIKPFILSEL